MRLTNVRFTDAQRARLDIAAESEGETMTEFIRNAVIMRIAWIETLAFLEATMAPSGEIAADAIRRMKQIQRDFLAVEQRRIEGQDTGEAG